MPDLALGEKSEKSENYAEPNVVSSSFASPKSKQNRFHLSGKTNAAVHEGLWQEVTLLAILARANKVLEKIWRTIQRHVLSIYHSMTMNGRNDHSLPHSVWSFLR